MKVVHVITGMVAGGAENALCRLLESGRPEVSAQHVLVLREPGPLSERARASADGVWHADMNPRRPSPRGLLGLRRRLLDLRPDVIQGWMYHGNLVASVAAVGLRAPVVWGVRQTLYTLADEPKGTRLTIRLGAALSSRVSSIVYNSRLSADQHAAFGFDSSQAVIIPNGYDLERFRPDQDLRRRFRGDWGIDDQAFVIGLAARAHPMKDHDNFLRAAALFVADHPNTRFLLAGEGTDDDALINRGIAAYGLQEAVIRCGRLDDTVAFNCALDVACMSSAWGDAFPNVLAEAMACGVPCVASEIGDAPAIVGDTGIVVPPRSPGALARGWARLAELGSAGRAALGARARERVAQRYTLQRSTQRYIELYRQLGSG